MTQVKPIVQFADTVRYSAFYTHGCIIYEEADAPGDGAFPAEWLMYVEYVDRIEYRRITPNKTRPYLFQVALEGGMR